MRTIPKRLLNAYTQLQKSRLVSKKHFDNDALLHFEKLLNSSLPTTEYENHIYYFIKDLYHNNINYFNMFVHNSNIQCFILYTNNKNIIEHFNLKYKIYINWNKNDKKYIVEKFKSKNYDNSINSISTLSYTYSSNSSNSESSNSGSFNSWSSNSGSYNSDNT